MPKATVARPAAIRVTEVERTDQNLIHSLWITLRVRTFAGSYSVGMVRGGAVVIGVLVVRGIVGGCGGVAVVVIRRHLGRAGRRGTHGVGGEGHEHVFERALFGDERGEGDAVVAGDQPISLASRPADADRFTVGRRRSRHRRPASARPDRRGDRPRRGFSPAAMARRSSAEMSSIRRPWPMITKCSAMSSISLIRCDETKTVRPSSPGLEEVADPEDALGVETVDGLVEHHDLGVAQEGAAMPSRWPMPSEKPPLRRLATSPSPTSRGRARPGRC